MSEPCRLTDWGKRIDWVAYDRRYFPGRLRRAVRWLRWKLLGTPRPHVHDIPGWYVEEGFVEALRDGSIRPRES